MDPAAPGLARRVARRTGLIQNVGLEGCAGRSTEGAARLAWGRYRRTSPHHQPRGGGAHSQGLFPDFREISRAAYRQQRESKHRAQRRAERLA